MKRRKKASKGKSNVVHPNVSRLDYESNHGYSVRIQRKGKETSRLFSDSVYGGKRKAKAAAIAWREKIVKRVGKAMKGGQSAPAKPPGYSTLKRRPVSLVTNGKRRKVMCWVGFLRIEDRKHLSTTWSIDKHGEEKALAGCKAWLVAKKAELAARLRNS